MPVVTPHQAHGPDGGAPAADHTTPARPAPYDAGSEGRDPIGPTGSTGTTVEPAPRRRRWWRPVAAAAAVLAVGGAATAVVLAQQESSDSGSAEDEAGDGAGGAPVRITAVEAEQRDLAEYEEVDGTFSYGEPTTVTAGVAGTVTSVADAGDTLTRGDTAYEVDTVPVVVMWGDTPVYRTLDDGVDDGRDVRTLEENLSALGFDADGELVVDDSFDDATETAVEQWEADIGAVEDGVVDPSQVVVLPGPAIVESAETAVGATLAQGSAVLTVSVTEQVTSVLSAGDGRITLVPTEGTVLATGDVAYELDTRPVVVIVGDEPLDRELTVGVDDGDDVVQLEEALVELGYDADGELVVDETFDEATAEAVTDWEDDLGLEVVDGIVQVGQYLVLEPDLAVSSVEVERGDDVMSGDLLFVTGTSTREVTGTIDSADEDLIVEGSSVEVELPDGTAVGGTIVAIDSSTTTDPAAADAEATTAFEVALDEVPESAAGRDQLDVTIRITRELAEGATVVPASALVSVGDGTYAVEVVDGTTTRYVAVEPGLFADGYVAVEGIEPGTAVVVPE